MATEPPAQLGAEHPPYSWSALRQALDGTDAFAARAPESELWPLVTLIRRQATALHAHNNVLRAAQRTIGSHPAGEPPRDPLRRQATEKRQRYTLASVAVLSIVTLLRTL
jgi:hypothetical protein